MAKKHSLGTRKSKAVEEKTDVTSPETGAGEPAPSRAESNPTGSPNGDVRRITLEHVLRTGFGTILSRLDQLSDRVAGLEAVLAQRTADPAPAQAAVPSEPVPEPPAEPTGAAQTIRSTAPAAAEAVMESLGKEPPPSVPEAPDPSAEEEEPLDELVWGPRKPPGRGATRAGAGSADEQPDERSRRRVRPPRMSFGRRDAESG